MTDQKIIEHLQHNNYSLALKGMYGLLPEVKKYIKANNGSDDDALDTFQEALVIVYKKLHSGNLVLTVTLKTYVMAVVKNCWLKELRQRNKLPIATTEMEFADVIIDEEPGFQLATAAFNLLGEKCKQLLLLFYFKKKNYKDIATTLAFADEKVAKNQKYRCLQKAKENYITLSTDNHE